MAKVDRSKYWCGTSYDFSDFAGVSGLKYGVWQKERCKSTGREHFQFHLEFNDRLRFPQVQALLPGVHVERVRDIELSRSYAQKEDTRIEGPFFFGKLKERKREFNAISELARRSVSEVLEDYPEYWRSVQCLRIIRALSMPARKLRTGLVYVWGKTGCGKTSMMLRMSKHLDVFWYNHSSRWWCGYEQQPIVVVDEYHGSFKASELLRFGDSTPFQLEIKGGSVQFDSVLVVFLSNLSPDKTVFVHDEEINNALRRRFSLVPM